MARSKRNVNSNETTKVRITERNLLSQTSDVSSLNESPFVENPSLSNVQEHSYSDDDAGNNTDNCDVSDGEEISQTSNVLNANRASIFDYPEWVTLKKIPYISKNGQEKFKSGWECNFCKRVFDTRNATKAICHLAGVKGHHVSKCQAIIPKKHLSVIKERNRIREKKQSNNVKVKSEIVDNIVQQQQSIVCGLEAMSESVKQGTLCTNASTSTVRTVTQYHQQQLDIAISDFIFSKGLPFSICDSNHFKRLLQLARFVNKEYKIPNRNRMSSDLLDHSYAQRIKDYKTKLNKEAERFGISMYGDGATVMKMPLINVMASGIYKRSAILDIVDATEHMSNGFIKDAQYVAELFIPHIEAIDPDQCLVDTVFFDGAANVQKAGQILAATYPRISVLHGAEHVVSLFSRFGKKTILFRRQF